MRGVWKVEDSDHKLFGGNWEFRVKDLSDFSSYNQNLKTVSCFKLTTFFKNVIFVVFFKKTLSMTIGYKHCFCEYTSKTLAYPKANQLALKTT